MNAIQVGFTQKTLLSVCSAMIMTLASQGLVAGDFAEVTYLSNSVEWQTFLPEDATGVEVRVVYTPPNVLEDSYLDKLRFKRSEQRFSYPFFSDLEDGSYTWEMRLLKKGPVHRGFDLDRKGPEREIDGNGREIDIVGKSNVVKGRVLMSNSGRDTTQTGSFVVVKGIIPDVGRPEQGGDK